MTKNSLGPIRDCICSEFKVSVPGQTNLVNLAEHKVGTIDYTYEIGIQKYATLSAPKYSAICRLFWKKKKNSGEKWKHTKTLLLGVTLTEGKPRRRRRGVKSARHRAESPRLIWLGKHLQLASRSRTVAHRWQRSLNSNWIAAQICRTVSHCICLSMPS